MADGRKRGTYTLTPEGIQAERQLAPAPGALRATVSYRDVPEPSRRHKPLDKPWQVVFIHMGYPRADVVGLALYDDVVLGRLASPSERPDVDLSSYDAFRHGVSRKHALLRPSLHQLFLIDLGSANGTMVNSVPQELGMARALKHNDTVSLANLHLTIKIMQQPGSNT